MYAVFRAKVYSQYVSSLPLNPTFCVLDFGHVPILKSLIKLATTSGFQQGKCLIRAREAACIDSILDCGRRYAGCSKLAVSCTACMLTQRFSDVIL